MIYIRQSPTLYDILDLLEEGLIDADDAWILLNARNTPWWCEKVAVLLDRYMHSHIPGASAQRSVRLVHEALNHLYGQKFY